MGFSYGYINSLKEQTKKQKEKRGEEEKVTSDQKGSKRKVNPSASPSPSTAAVSTNGEEHGAHVTKIQE